MMVNAVVMTWLVGGGMLLRAAVWRAAKVRPTIA
jgi:hypothetical protein